MIRFIIAVYLTIFTLVFRFSASKNIANNAYSTCFIIAFVEWWIILGVVVDTGSLARFSKLESMVVFFALNVVNIYFLFIRGHGVKFESKFSSLEKPKRFVLIVSGTVVMVAALAFVMHSVMTHLHPTAKVV